MTFVSCLRRLVVENDAQDLIEYALLAGVLTATAVAVFPQLPDQIGQKLTTWGDSTHDIWIPNCPGTNVPCP